MSGREVVDLSGRSKPQALWARLHFAQEGAEAQDLCLSGRPRPPRAGCRDWDGSPPPGPSEGCAGQSHRAAPLAPVPYAEVPRRISCEGWRRQGERCPEWCHRQLRAGLCRRVRVRALPCADRVAAFSHLRKGRLPHHTASVRLGKGCPCRGSG